MSLESRTDRWACPWRVEQADGHVLGEWNRQIGMFLESGQTDGHVLGEWNRQMGMSLESGTDRWACPRAVTCCRFDPFPNNRFFDSSKLKEFADDYFVYDENVFKFFKRVENTVGKGEIACYKQLLLFPQCFQRLVLQTRKNQGL